MDEVRQRRADQRLHRAAEQLDLAAAKNALDEGADPNNGLADDSVLMRVLDGGYTLLDTTERTALIELLLSRGADPNGHISGRDPAEAPIHTAAGFGMIEAVKALHRGGADINLLSLDERMTALGTADSNHWFHCGARLGDDYFGGVLPATVDELPDRFRHPTSEDINARVVHWLWGIQQVIPFLRSNGGLMEWELQPLEHSLLDAVCFAPDSPCRYYRPGSIKARRNHHPIAKDAFDAVPIELQDKYEAWCVEFIDPWEFGPASARVSAYDYDDHAARGLRLLNEFMGRLARPGLEASVNLYASAAIAAGCHLCDQYDWSWSERRFIKRVSWKDVPHRSLLGVE